MDLTYFLLKILIRGLCIHVLFPTYGHERLPGLPILTPHSVASQGWVTKH